MSGLTSYYSVVTGACVIEGCWGDRICFYVQGCCWRTNQLRWAHNIAAYMHVLQVFIPFLIFGVLAMLGGLLTLLMPETLGARMPEQVEVSGDILAFVGDSHNMHGPQEPCTVLRSGQSCPTAYACCSRWALLHVVIIWLTAVHFF